jgi:uncharacterized protein YndB with AHSA1/START domain
MVKLFDSPYFAAVKIETTGRIQWRVCMKASVDTVYRMLTTNEGRRAFWAHSADEVEPGIIEFRFLSGDTWRSAILERQPPTRFRLTYFSGSELTFDLDKTSTGTVVTATETGVPEGDWLDNHAGWVSVLLNLKAVVDFGADLRNGVAERSWQKGFVDI